jgi:hypothetical protein
MIFPFQQLFALSLVACAASFLVLGLAPYAAAFYRKQPGSSWFEAAFVTTLLFHPDWYLPRGQRIRRFWIASLVGFFLFGTAAALLAGK